MDDIHICVATGQTFIARVRRVGCRKYDVLGKPTKIRGVAVSRMADAMATGNFKRGDVLLCADYYDPLPVFEMVKR